MSKQAFKRLRRKLGMAVERKPLDAFAWPGGYPIYYLCEDGGVLCPDCVNKEITLIDQAAPRQGLVPLLKAGDRYVHRHDGHDKQWTVVAYDAHMEGEPLTCDHCNKDIESAYGPVEESRAT